MALQYAIGRQRTCHDPNAENPEWMQALWKVRRMVTRKGYLYQRVQTIILSIDQHAESATGNREYLWPGRDVTR